MRLSLATKLTRGIVKEWALLLTCGRLELYACLGDQPGTAKTALTDLLAEATAVPPSLLNGHIYHHNGSAAVHHLCRVAAGLDSVVLGEAQILGQVGEAGATAVSIGSAGPFLKTLFQTAVHAGKRARTETAIGRHPASISSLAIALAQEKAGDLHQRQILLIGLGEMGQLALKALQARRISQISLANRTRSLAETIATYWGYSVYDLADLPAAVTEADVVLSAVETERPLLDADSINSIMSTRLDRPLVIVDLSLPRSISRTAATLPNVHLFDLDDLRNTLDDSLTFRQQAVPQVEDIVDQEVEHFIENLQTLAIEPLISSLRQRAEAIRRQEMARTLHRLGDLDHATLNHIQHLSHSLVNKLLHEPTLRLRQHAGEVETNEYAAVIRDLFNLEKGEE